MPRQRERRGREGERERGREREGERKRDSEGEEEGERKRRLVVRGERLRWYTCVVVAIIVVT